MRGQPNAATKASTACNPMPKKPTKTKPEAPKEAAAPAAPEKRPPGRPTKYTKEIGEEICRLMVEEVGYKGSLRGICSREDMPAVSTLCKWLTVHKEFAELYTRARDAQVELELSDIIVIADDGSEDWETRTTANGTEYQSENKEVTRRSELRVNARLKRAGMLAPRKYGTLVKQEISGPNGGAVSVTLSGADERI
jgi:hypothetical protein